MHHCVPINWESDAVQWCRQKLLLADWRKHLIESNFLHPLFHHWLLNGQRSMRGVRMNTLGWFDFKSV